MKPILVVDETQSAAASQIVGALYEVVPRTADLTNYFGRSALVWSVDSSIPNTLWALSCSPIKQISAALLSPTAALEYGYDWNQFKEWARANVTEYKPAPLPDAPSMNGHHKAPTPVVNMTDLGNAKYLVHHHGDLMRYCYRWRKWLVWDSKRWAIDDTAAAERLAKDAVGQFYVDAVQNPDLEVRGRLLKHALKSEGAASINNMLALARSEPGIPILHDELDRNPWLFNVSNGTLNLKTMDLLPHRQSDLIAQLSPVAFDPKSECPLWLAFLDRVTNSNPSIIGFLRRAVGYALTGDTSEQVLFFLYGTGRNGKSTFVETIRALFGEYAQQMPADSLMVKHGQGIPSDIARLRGVRFAVSMETEEGRRMAESLIKQLTGGDRISARFMHSDWFEFTPTHKLFLCTNHKPIIRGTDNAIWRRIRLVPFSVTIPVEEVDPELKNKLLLELPGIFRWALQGCMEWQKNGLGCPVEVEEATAEYKKEMDVLGDFLRDCIDEFPGAQTGASEIYRAYKDWCENGGEFCLSQKKFGQAMIERGYDSKRTNQGFFYSNIRVKS